MKVRRVDLYAADWLEGTVELSDVEFAIYTRACFLIYARGGPIKIELLRRVCSSHGKTFNFVLERLEKMSKWDRNGDEIDVKRCRNELERSSKRAQSFRENGVKGGRPNGLAKPPGFDDTRARGINQQPSINIEEKEDFALSSESEESSPVGSHATAPRRPRATKTSPPIPIEQWGPSPAHQQQAMLAGHDDAWLFDQADRYRDQQVNAKLKHRDREAGFRNWIRNAPNFEVKLNGHANGQRKLSAVDNLFLGAARAAEAVARRQCAGGSPVAALLDRG